MNRTAYLILCLALFGSISAHPPSGIAFEAPGRVYFTSGPRILSVEPDGPSRTLVHDSKNERFYQLHHLQRAPDGGWLTASDFGNAIWHFTADGTLTRFYPPPNEDRPLSVGSGGDPFAVDPAGNIYAVNSVQDRFTQIIKIAPDGRLRFLAGGDWGFTDGPGEMARFADLHSGSLHATTNGTLFLTDNSTRVRRVAPDGTTITVAGGSQSGSVDGRGTEARFDGASGLTLDPQGNLWVAENVGRIRKISPDGMVTTLTGSNRAGYQDGPLTEATFSAPSGITVAPNGDLYVLEPEIPRIRKISAGQVTTIHP